jgi:hypothetical protein
MKVDCISTELSNKCKYVLINEKRVRRDVKLGDLLTKTNNGWYVPAINYKQNLCGFGNNSSLFAP